MVPYLIKMTDIQAESELVVTYEEVKIDPELPAGFFTIEPPAGVESGPITAEQGT